MAKGGSRKIDFKVYKEALIEVAKYYKGQTLNKDEMEDFWGLVERAYRHNTGLVNVFHTRQFIHNATAIPILKRRSMVSVKRLEGARHTLHTVMYSFSGGTDE